MMSTPHCLCIVQDADSMEQSLKAISICLDLDMVTHHPSKHIRNQSAMMNSDISCGVLRLVP